MFPPALVRSESGQSLVLITLAMGLIVALAAFSIDVAQWNVGRHKAQLTADATALAAANCLASGDCSSTSTTPPGDAAGKGNAIAADNGFPSSAVSMTISASAVSVKITASVASSFAGFFGMPSETVSASAVASYTPPSSKSCSTPGSSCAAVFAMGNSCSLTGTPPSGSPIIFNGAGDTIQGTVHSNGSINEETGGSQSLGATTFGNGSGCEVDTTGSGGNDTWNGSSTAPSTGEAPIATWPDDYSQVVTPCGTGEPYACTGPDGTPSYCTEAAGTAGYSSANGAGSASGFNYGSKTERPIANQVWCAYGSGTQSQPSTWDGQIYFQSDSTSVTGNWIGGTINFGNTGWTLNPQLASFPVLYATGATNSSTYATAGCTAGWVCITSTNVVNGSIFAPTGWIEFNANGSTTENFLEAQGIEFIGGSENVIGEGPPSGGGSTSPGTDSLTS